MGHIADKVTAHLFELVQPCYVLGDNQTVVVTKQADLDLKVNMRSGRRMYLQGFAVIP